MVPLTLVDRLKLSGAEIQSHRGTPPRALLFPLAGQTPGEHCQEHDKRMKTAALCWSTFTSIGWDCRILCSGGTADRNGLTAARYMARQINTHLEDHMRWDADSFIIIGEEVSGHTARNIRGSRKSILNASYDMVVLISNGPHLWPAGAYFRQLIPETEMPFVKWSSGNGRGCLGMLYPLYLLREILHYLAAITFDRQGLFLDGRTEKKIQEWSQLTFPEIPQQP